MNGTRRLTLVVNGEAREEAVESRLLLSDFLRDTLGLTGTHVGCEHGVCGACTVLLDGKAVRSCLLFAVQAEGREVTTIEGLSGSGAISDLQDAFSRHHALQCGFCTAGMMAVAQDLLSEMPHADLHDIRDGMSAAFCRCTGYAGIVKAVSEVAEARRARTGREAAHIREGRA